MNKETITISLSQQDREMIQDIHETLGDIALLGLVFTLLCTLVAGHFIFYII